MPDYANTVIYKICCKNTDITDIYVGHTTNIKRRINNHKDSCNNPKNNRYHLKVYEFIHNNGGWDNWNIIVLEEYPCNSRSDAIKKEREYYETLKPTLNTYYPQRTDEEYKEYYYNNKENKECKKQYNKEYYNDNKECIKQYRNDNKEYTKECKKQYYIENKNIINEYKKQYRIINNEKIKEKAKEKVICECGCEIRKSDLKKHQKTKKHLANLSI